MDRDTRSKLQREDFERLIDGRNISSVEMDAMGQLIVPFYFASASSTGRLHGEWVFTSDMPAYQSLLEITGPMLPGGLVSVMKPFLIENEYPVAVLAQGLEEDFFRSAQMQEDGGIWLRARHLENTPDKSVLKFPPHCEQVSVILKRTGPMQPGDLFEF